jgi:hypothetical protein
MSRALFVCLVCLLSGFLEPRAGVAQPPAGAFPDVRKAKAELAEAREELEEIAGPELALGDPPPLPVLESELAEEVELSEEASDRGKRLLGLDPSEWSAADREWVEGLLPLDLRLRAALGGEGVEIEGPEELAGHMIPLLHAVRVLALRDRLAFADRQPGGEVEGKAAAFADGLELRQALAERLVLQHALLGPLFANTLHLGVLRDVRWAVGRAETPPEVLERIDGLLFRWRQGVPDSAAVAALHGLSLLERVEKSTGELGGADEPAGAALLAPLARDFADLARICRESSCAEGVDFVVRRMKRSDDPFRAVTDLMMPNVYSMLSKMDAGARVNAVAGVAVAFRLEALEMGGYPPDPEDLPDALAATFAEAEALTPGLKYEPPGAEGRTESAQAGRARLRVISDDLFSGWPEFRQADLERLLVWELPPPSPLPPREE